MDFQQKLNDIIARARQGHISPPCKLCGIITQRAILYDIYQTKRGRRRGVAFGMTDYEAHILLNLLKRKIEREEKRNETEKILLEVMPQNKTIEEV